MKVHRRHHQKPHPPPPNPKIPLLPQTQPLGDRSLPCAETLPAAHPDRPQYCHPNLTQQREEREPKAGGPANVPATYLHQRLFLPAFGEFGDVLRPTCKCGFIMRGGTARLCTCVVQTGRSGLWHWLTGCFLSACNATKSGLLDNLPIYPSLDAPPSFPETYRSVEAIPAGEKRLVRLGGRHGPGPQLVIDSCCYHLGLG